MHFLPLKLFCFNNLLFSFSFLGLIETSESLYNVYPSFVDVPVINPGGLTTLAPPVVKPLENGADFCHEDNGIGIYSFERFPDGEEKLVLRGVSHVKHDKKSLKNCSQELLFTDLARLGRWIHEIQNAKGLLLLINIQKY